MNIYEFKEYMSTLMDKELFLEQIKKQIISSNEEIEKKYRVPEDMISEVANKVFNKMIEDSYSKILKGLSKKEKFSREAWENKISSLEIIDELERSLYE